MPTKDSKPLPAFSESDVTRFWSKVDRSGGPDACWPWTAGKYPKGYGCFWIDGHGVHAHRVSLYLHSGIDPLTLQTCHTCDIRYNVGDATYRKCCNFEHLVRGTNADNHAHKSLSGRAAVGARHGAFKRKDRLTPAQVLMARTLHAKGITNTAIAKMLGCAQPTISIAVNRKSWKHLD